MLVLKDYQQRSLDELAKYFRFAVQHDAKAAFVTGGAVPG